MGLSSLGSTAIVHMGCNRGTYGFWVGTSVGFLSALALKKIQSEPSPKFSMSCAMFSVSVVYGTLLGATVATVQSVALSYLFK